VGESLPTHGCATGTALVARGEKIVRARTRRISAFALSGALLLAPVVLVAAPSATAAPGDKAITLTAAQLTDAGFPKTPNTAAWDPGTAALLTQTAAQWQDVVITGKAPRYADPGALLTMSRFVPSDLKGSGVQKPLNITAYAVGDQTEGTSPEFIGFQFQFTTTGSGKALPGGRSSAVTLGEKELAAAGFTKQPNVVGWGGTATISAHRVQAGAPVTLKGTAPATLKAGTALTLNRFTATDKQGSGSFTPVGGISTSVKVDGTYSLTFEVNERGRYGYTFGAGLNEGWLGVEFQLKATWC
jgi:hypothetical protein